MRIYYRLGRKAVGFGINPGPGYADRDKKKKDILREEIFAMMWWQTDAQGSLGAGLQCSLYYWYHDFHELKRRCEKKKVKKKNKGNFLRVRHFMVFIRVFNFIFPFLFIPFSVFGVAIVVHILA